MGYNININVEDCFYLDFRDLNYLSPFYSLQWSLYTTLVIIV